MANDKTTTALATVDDSATGMDSAAGFATLQRVATMFAAATLVPDTFKNNLPNCAIAVHMALRMRADPLMVMQNLYVVHGRPGWSSQFLIATFNQCGRFSAIRFEWSGIEGKDDWGCTAWAIEKATGEKLAGSKITIALAKAEGWSSRAGSKWKTMPQQMMMYRAAAFFIRAYAPELAMGLPTAEEVEDIAREAIGHSEGGVYPARQTLADLVSTPDAEIVALPDAETVIEEPVIEPPAEKKPEPKAAKKPEPPADDLKPYWLLIISECKDIPSLNRKHSQFESVKRDMPEADAQAIEEAFANRVTEV